MRGAYLCIRTSELWSVLDLVFVGHDAVVERVCRMLLFDVMGSWIFPVVCFLGVLWGWIRCGCWGGGDIKCSMRRIVKGSWLGRGVLGEWR